MDMKSSIKGRRNTDRCYSRYTDDADNLSKPNGWNNPA